MSGSWYGHNKYARRVMAESLLTTCCFLCFFFSLKKHYRQRDGSNLIVKLPCDKTFLDEFKEVIDLKVPNKITTKDGLPYDDETIGIENEDDTVITALREYLTVIATMYQSNSFHNFEHACHVTMSVNKLINRIVMYEETNLTNQTEDVDNVECTSFLNSDPLAQFAILFSAIIHDVDHRGCSNSQLMKEDTVLSERFKQKSVAEQNSLALAWELLMSTQFKTLREEIFGNMEDLLRFRQIIINLVLATDIFDKELNKLRNFRWQKAFHLCRDDDVVNDGKQSNRRATIVMEHIIQASDVAHTMQHWHVYQKWNQQLFSEMYTAYQDGRMATDPSTFWYKGELDFFDNYVIPLAKKLKDCQVFGVSSDEYLNYAGEHNQGFFFKLLKAPSLTFRHLCCCCCCFV
jgi:3'5'-cyclic nucleotide phosphodiesterase